MRSLLDALLLAPGALAPRGASSAPAAYAAAGSAFNYSALGQLVLGGAFDGLSTPQAPYAGSAAALANISVLVQTALDAQPAPLAAPTNSSDVLLNTAGRLYAAPFADGAVELSCVLGDELLVVVGNFSTVLNTSVTGGMALVNASGDALAVTGIASGNVSASTVRALACANSTIYAGGSFTLDGAAGVAVANASDPSGWALPLFGGFYAGGVVNSIAQADGSLVFGGDFVYPSVNTTFNSSAIVQPGSQIVSLRDANATAYAESGAVAQNASALLCASDGGWAAAENSVTGYVDIGLPHVAYLTKLRVYNRESTPAKTFRVQAYPPGGIMNLTYASGGATLSCTAECPLPRNQSTGYTEFTFVNVIPATSLRVSLLDFYDSTAGLDGVVLFEQDQSIYANNDYNLPRACSSGEQTGESVLAGSFSSVGDYIAANITDKQDLGSYSVQYEPIMSAFTADTGKYEIFLYTPGCEATSTCSSRGAVNVTVYPGFGSAQSTTLWQTNEAEKYDSIYTGVISAGTYIEVAPLSTSQVPLEFVAYKVALVYSAESSAQFSTRNVFEYSTANYSAASVSENTLANTTVSGLTPINALNLSSTVSAVHAHNGTLYIAAQNFTLIGAGSQFTQINGLPTFEQFYTSLDAVFASASNDTYLVSNETFVPLGTGYAKSVADLDIDNVTYAAMFLGDSASSQVALWTGSALAANSTAQRVRGFARAVAYNESANQSVLLGNLELVDSLVRGCAAISGNTSSTAITPLALFAASSGTANSSVYDGLYLNRTHGIIVGRFSNVVDSNGNGVAHAAVFSSQGTTTLPLNSSDAIADSSTFRAVAVANNSVAVMGGSISGTVGNSSLGGLLVYNYSSSTPFANQPASAGSNASVAALVFRPNSSTVVAAGNFSTQGCEGVCLCDLTSGSWSSLKSLSANASSLVNDLVFATGETLVLGGSLYVNGSTAQVVVYNFTDNSAQLLPALPGVVTSVAVNNQTNASAYYAAGIDTASQVPFVQQYDQDTDAWSSVPDLPSLQNGSVVSRLSLIAQNNNSTRVLAVSGRFVLASGTASMLAYDGSRWGQVYVATTSEDGEEALLRTVFSQLDGDLKGGVSVSSATSTNTTSTPSGTPSGTPRPSARPSAEAGRSRVFMPTGHVVGVACGIGIGCVFLLSTVYVIVEYLLRASSQYPYQTLTQNKVLSSESVKDSNVVR